MAACPFPSTTERPARWSAASHVQRHNTAAWQIDQTGQLGLIPTTPGYRPPASDVQPFQMALETELSKLGF
jgi:hypothetical protein